MFPSRIKSASNSSEDSDVVVDFEMEDGYQVSKRRKYDPPVGIAPNSKPYDKISMLNTLKNVFLFRRPGYTPSPEALKDFQDEMERRLRLKSSSGEDNGIGREANCYRKISIHPTSIPEDISFDKMMMCATFPPINMAGFKAFLTNIDYNAENLDFLLYVQHYANLFDAVAEDERGALSPVWTYEDEENAKKTIMGISKSSHKVNPNVPHTQRSLSNPPSFSDGEADTQDIKAVEEHSTVEASHAGGPAIKGANDAQERSSSLCTSVGAVNVQDIKDDEEHFNSLGSLGSTGDEASIQYTKDYEEHSACTTGGEAGVRHMEGDEEHSGYTTGSEASGQDKKGDEERSITPGTLEESRHFSVKTAFSDADMDAIAPFAKHDGFRAGTQGMGYHEGSSSVPKSSIEGKHFSLKGTFSETDMDAIAPFAKIDSIAMSTKASVENTKPIGPELPIAVKNLWKESERIAKAFISTDGPKQLNLSSKERELVLFALERSNHPSAFAGALRAADAVLRNDSYPKFLQLATPNMNRIRQQFAYTMGYVCIILGVVYATILSLTRVRREWRLFGVPLVVLGVATLFAARQGMCLVLHSFGHYQVKPWEVYDPEDAERAHANPEVFLGGKYNSESSDWVHRYNRRYAMRKIFDKEAPVEEPRIREAQNIIFGQGLYTGFVGSVFIMAVFMALPRGNDL